MSPDPVARAASTATFVSGSSRSVIPARPLRPSRPVTWSSKLGPHILGPTNNAAVHTILDACPPVAKWVTGYSGIDVEISSYKSHCSQGVVVLRVYIAPSVASYTVADDPVAAAHDFWNKMSSQGLSSAGSASLIDWLEGPNEIENLPATWYSDLTAANWVASFWSTLADFMHNAGYNPLVGSLVAGQPAPVSNFGPLAEAMKSKTYKWGWSYHAYTFTATNNIDTEMTYALYYREIRDQNGLSGIPLVLSEGGFLTPSSSGWHGQLNNDQYLSWLEWFDAQTKQDSEIVGFTIFQVGNSTDWLSFDLTPIAPQFAKYIASGP